LRTIELQVQTGSTLVIELTDDIDDFCRGLGDGLVNVFVPHATAGVAVIEVGSGSDLDLADTIDRLWPREIRYAHRHGTAGHGRDHVLPAFVSPSLMVPVIGGEPALGTWQSIVLVDPNVDNPLRTVRLSFIPA
jgi:secondary thiamine-phosphate synthase enzyme